LFYTSSSIESDESKVNKINLIIDDELNSTSSRIHNRLREIL